MWLFTELRNPAVGADGMPHVTTRVEIEGSAKSIPGTPVAAEATPLKGMRGHFGIGSTIDVTPLPPGDYNVRLTVTNHSAGGLTAADFELAGMVDGLVPS